MTIKLTYAQTKHDLFELAVNNPEYIYNTPPEYGDNCVYFTEKGEPSCIVGHVLAKYGIKKEDLVIGSWDGNKGTGPENLKSQRIFDASGKTISLLQAVQSRQDTGQPWGSAVKGAISNIEGE